MLDPGYFREGGPFFLRIRRKTRPSGRRYRLRRFKGRLFERESVQNHLGAHVANPRCSGQAIGP